MRAADCSRARLCVVLLSVRHGPPGLHAAMRTTQAAGDVTQQTRALNDKENLTAAARHVRSH